jgi:protein gp37
LMKKHKISWLNIPGYIPQTWNPIVGCSKVSEGCRNCYAERMAKRLAGIKATDYYRKALDIDDFEPPTWRIESGWSGETFFVESALEKPLGWEKPRAIFVNSMGDLFHENTPDEWIDRVHYIMAKSPQHLFILLTKRAKRMAEYYSVERCLYETNCGDYRPKASWPLPNVWLGVTAENQAAADERIPHLLRTPAAVRFVSCEPMIGPIDDLKVPLGEFFCPQCDNYFDIPERYLSPCCGEKTRGDDDYICTKCKQPFPEDEEIVECPNCGNSGGSYYIQPDHHTCFSIKDLPIGVDWIICGGESGPGARPMNPEWARSLRDQCQAAGVPFFFKQWGDNMCKHNAPPYYTRNEKHGGDILDGRQWHEFPEVAQ